MKNKLLRTFGLLIIFITFSTGVNYIPAHASWKIVPSDDGNTLEIHNEETGNLIKSFIKFRKVCSEDYKNLVISGEINSYDFGILETMSYECKTIDLSRAKTKMIPCGAFLKRDNLEKFILPETLKVIGSGAFAHCINMKIDRLPIGLETIGNGAFLYCERLNLTIPKEIKVGEDAFEYCPNVHFLEDDKTSGSKNDKKINSNEWTPSKTVFSSIVSYIYSWF